MPHFVKFFEKDLLESQSYRWRERERSIYWFTPIDCNSQGCGGPGYPTWMEGALTVGLSLTAFPRIGQGTRSDVEQPGLGLVPVSDAGAAVGAFPTLPQCQSLLIFMFRAYQSLFRFSTQFIAHYYNLHLFYCVVDSKATISFKKKLLNVFVFEKEIFHPCPQCPGLCRFKARS